MSFSASGLPDSVQRRRLLMPQCFSTRRVKARSFSTFCWMWIWAVSSRASSSGVCSAGLERGGSVDQEVSVLLVTGDVEAGAESENADGLGAQPPIVVGEVEGGGIEIGVGVVLVAAGGEAKGAECGIVALLGPELPVHLELVGHVVVELLGGFGDGGVDEFVGCFDGGIDWDGGVEVGRGRLDVDALVGGRLGEVNGIGGGSGDTLGADQCKLAQDAGKRGGKGLQAEVGIPEAEIEAVCHGGLF
jgi:hypothetical protein